MIFAKAYKINPNTATRIAGGLSAADIPELRVKSISPITKSLESDATVFRMAEVSMDLVGLDEDYFRDHNKDSLGNKARMPYVVEVQYGGGWDEVGAYVIFFGVLDGDSVEYDPVTGIPHHDPATMETNVPGVYIAGVLSAGFNANKVFIENGRGHGELIVRSVQGA